MSYYFLLNDGINSIVRIRFYNNYLVCVTGPKVEWNKELNIDQWIEQGYLSYDTHGSLIKGPRIPDSFTLKYSVGGVDYTITIDGTGKGSIKSGNSSTKDQVKAFISCYKQLGISLIST